MYAGNEVAAQIELLEVRQHLNTLCTPQHVALHRTRTQSILRIAKRAILTLNIASYHTHVRPFAVCQRIAKSLLACIWLQHVSAAVG